MARLEKLSNTKWKQSFRDRQREFRLWSSHTEVAEYCEIEDGTKRYLKIDFEHKFGLSVEDFFTITSGREIRFSKELQDVAKEIILENPESFFTVEVLDITDESGTDGEPKDLEDEFIEGKRIEKKHISRERNSALVKAKKSYVLAENGKLSCEICRFDFAEVYGELGSEFIECHHLIPLSKLNKSVKTKLSDLSLICPNCHRMVHRHIKKDQNASTVQQLKTVLLKNV